MPLMLTPNERAMLYRLAAPVDQRRQPEFVAAVEAKLEAAGAAIGEGSINRAVRMRHRGFLDRAAGPRASRLGGRGPRNAQSTLAKKLDWT